MNVYDIEWKEPWRAIQYAAEIPSVQRQFEREITSRHPLHGKEGKVIGRRIDNDDVVALLNDGTYVNVHLVWGGGTVVYPEQYPVWFSYASLASFASSMNEDAIEYGE